MSQRVLRLVSAGVPLSRAFEAVAEEIIDNGPADLDTLTKRVEDAMRYKEARILGAAAWRTWSDFTRDIVDQISGADGDAKSTLMLIQGKYSAPAFTYGAEYVVIDNPRITFTIWDEETRLKRDLAARMQMDVIRLKGETQTLLDRYPDAADDIRQQLKRNVGSFANMEKRLSGRVPAPVPEYAEFEPPRRQGTSRKGIKPRRHGITESVEEYAREFPEFWFTKETIVEYWNQRHPEEPPLNSRKDTGSIRRELAERTGSLLERRGDSRNYQYRLAQVYK